ncbi:MAG: hypothetical protein ABI718_14895 [Acidobacteriota bacterium]
MHILITDSGVGGLSVVAYAERFLRTRGFTEPVRLTFANAAPANDFGYNSMTTMKEKLDTFDRFLRNVTRRFAPDSIYVACNTLSVLLPDTPYFPIAAIEIQGIVETGVQLLLHDLASDPRSTAIIFGTQTTIDSGVYRQRLEARGIDFSRIINQACPGLADTISEDRLGTRTAAEIRNWVRAATKTLDGNDAEVVACLACTHYGYRQEMFSESFEELGIAAKVLNPNERAASQLFATADDRQRQPQDNVDVHVVTRYRIPEATVEALTYFLSDISPRTVEALQNFEHDSELF